jgi:sarcosine oxidase subunit beta
MSQSDKSELVIGGGADRNGDRSPIIGRTPVDGMFINYGWGAGGFKATPGSGHCFAESRMIDESVAVAVAH